MDNKESKYSPAYLKKWNMVAGILHSLQTVVMFGAAFGVDGVKDFTIPLTFRYQSFNETTRRLFNEDEKIADVKVGLIVPFFLLLSALAHFTVISPCFFDTYISDLDKGLNKFRWYEYAASSSLMIWAISMFFGVQDLATLMLIFGINASMNLFGYMMEVVNQYTDKVQWASFWFGCWAGVFPWVIVFMYFIGSGSDVEIPGFVYAILFSYLLFFNTFPINMVLQYKKVGPWADYKFGEMGYILLSLLSKSLLAWLVFGGTFQPKSEDGQ